MTWAPAVFPARARGRLLPVYGQTWRTWGIDARGGWFTVTHLPSHKRISEFDSLHCARRFCETIDEFADWTAEDPAAYDPDLALPVHRAALDITEGRPALRVIAGGVSS